MGDEAHGLPMISCVCVLNVRFVCPCRGKGSEIQLPRVPVPPAADPSPVATFVAPCPGAGGELCFVARIRDGRTKKPRPVQDRGLDSNARFELAFVLDGCLVVAGREHIDVFGLNDQNLQR